MVSPDSPVFYRNLSKKYRTIVSGKGVYLRDSDGRSYLDAVGGAGVVVIGHGVSLSLRALAGGSGDVPYVYGEDFTTPWQEELARRLLALCGTDGGAVYFVSGGSEANETAIKMAREFHLHCGQPQRHKIISRWLSFHGVTLGTLSVSGRTTWRAAFDPYLYRSPHIVPPYCYRCPLRLTYPECDVACADDLERAILLEGPESVAAFIAEPVIGTTVPGVTPVPEYYQRVRDICDKYGILFIADEILTGYGRTGLPLAMQHWSVEPDITTLGKGIGSGYAALGAVVASEKVVQAFRAGSGIFRHGFTYSGLPVSCFVGLSVLEYANENKLFDRTADLGAHLDRQLKALARDHAQIGDVRVLGLLAGIEFVADQGTRTPIEPSVRYAQRIVEGAAERGVLLRAGVSGSNYGQGGDQIQISPPYVILDNQIDRVVEVLDDVLCELAPLVR